MCYMLTRDESENTFDGFLLFNVLNGLYLCHIHTAFLLCIYKYTIKKYRTNLYPQEFFLFFENFKNEFYQTCFTRYYLSNKCYEKIQS